MEKERKIFCCEDTADGIFTAVYDAWASGFGLSRVTVQAGGTYSRSLFASYVESRTDHEKAKKVARTLRERLGTEDYQMIYHAALSEAEDKGEIIFAAVVMGLAVWKRKHMTRNLGDPRIMRLFELARRVENEGHHYRMFIRFHELEGRAGETPVMFSEIEPENQVLSLLGDHFSDRFHRTDFMICDRSHRQCLVHRAGADWILMTDVWPDEERISRYSREEKKYAGLWKTFVDSIAIRERENPRCQMNFMPKRYWKHMTEHQPVS